VFAKQDVLLVPRRLTARFPLPFATSSSSSMNPTGISTTGQLAKESHLHDGPETLSSKRGCLKLFAGVTLGLY
jgi:hypothetical protein